MTEAELIEQADNAREFIANKKNELTKLLETTQEDNTYQQVLEDFDILTYLDNLVVEELRSIFE